MVPQLSGSRRVENHPVADLAFVAGSWYFAALQSAPHHCKGTLHADSLRLCCSPLRERAVYVCDGPGGVIEPVDNVRNLLRRPLLDQWALQEEYRELRVGFLLPRCCGGASSVTGGLATQERSSADVGKRAHNSVDWIALESASSGRSN